MRKIALILLLTITIPTHATTMCAANDTVAVVLDPSISMSVVYADNTNGKWAMQSSVGTFYGVSTCLNKGLQPGEYQAHLRDIYNSETKYVTGIERYGRACWCKLVHPVSSLWVYNYTFGSVYNCSTMCAGHCVDYIRSNILLRRGLFGSVAN